MSINLFTNPYYDDFNEDKGFHQILFRPGYSVQARELTQIQSIIRDQIAKFGGHVFKHGSVVIPGNSSSNLNVCYVKLANAPVIDKLVGMFVKNETTGLRGLIKAGLNAVDGDPSTLYVEYTNTGFAAGTTSHVFSSGDAIVLEEAAGTVLTVGAAALSVGGASMATISKGVFFVNGSFVTVLNQSVVIGKYTTKPSCHVLLQIKESIIDSDRDSTLLDPAQGSYNYAAPGADRLKIELTLTSLPLDSSISSDYVEIMRFNEGVLEEHLRYSKYNELEKNLARRTYDESGDYVVSGLDVTTREHLKTALNGGRYTDGDVDKMIYTIASGKAYIRGFETEVFSAKELIVDKARSAAHIKTTVANLVPSFGQFLYVTNLVNLPSFSTREVITLYNANTAGDVIGTARALAADYHEPNTTDANAVFKLFVSDLALTGGNDVSDIGQVSWSGGSAVVLNRYSIVMSNTTDFVLGNPISNGGTGATLRTAVVHKFSRVTSNLYAYKDDKTKDMPTVGDNVVGTAAAPQGAGKMTSSETLGKNVNNNLILRLPKRSVKTVTIDGVTRDITYKTYHAETVAIAADGSGSFSVTGMTLDPKEQGNLIITSGVTPFVYPISVATVSSPTTMTFALGALAAAITIKVVCAVTKTASSPKTKTLTRVTESGLTPGATVQLVNADGVRLVSVESTVDGIVTDRFTFNNGQDDYAYYRPSLTLMSTTTPGGTLNVTYDYFAHNAGTGDYFSVDSYISSTMADYFTAPLLEYYSKNTGLSFDLRNCLDFRPRVGVLGEFSGTGSLANELPQVDSRLTTSLQSYVGREDAIIMPKGGGLTVITGLPSENPILPAIPADALYLAKVLVTPYTYSAAALRTVKQNNKGYTMKDVGSLETRLKDMEDYVTLSQTENNVINFDVIDAKTGLSRFKSGYLVDTFTDPDAIGDVNNPLFRVAYTSGNIMPQFEVIDTDLTTTANSCQVTGNVVTLPYTHEVVARQPVSSRITNINPFSVFSWKGALIITPAVDSWVEVENLNAIVNNINEVFETTSTIATTEIVNRTEVINIRRPWGDLSPVPVTPPTVVIVNQPPRVRILFPTFPPIPLPVVVGRFLRRLFGRRRRRR